MEKRLIVTIALSMLALIAWSAFVPKTYNIENKEVTENKIAAPASPIKQITAAVSEENYPASSLFKNDQEKFEVTFIEPKASVKEVVFKNHQAYKFPLKYGFLSGDPNLLFKKETSTNDSVIFVYSDQEKRITKKFTFSKSSYSIWLELIIQNLSSAPIKINSPLLLGELDFDSKNLQARYQDVTVKQRVKVLHLDGKKDSSFSDIEFLGIRDRYFCAIVEPKVDNSTGIIREISPQASEIGLSFQEINLPPGQKLEQKFHIYLGPQDLKQINSINPNWAAIINYGTFDIISQMLLQLLEFFYKLVHNWGWAIVILSIAIYFILYPLTLKQMRSMKEMQALQPRIEELRKTYKDNPQKLNKEIMELYREHKVNPFGGCLPLLLQMPIFFALYQALMRSIVLKGADFLWIKDLSEPDRLFILPVTLPVLGNEINILPIIMAVGMFFQQKISMASTSSGTPEQQKIMLIVFPIMFGFIFYHMPSGLVLYWLINSVLTLTYQLRIRRAK